MIMMTPEWIQIRVMISESVTGQVDQALDKIIWRIFTSTGQECGIYGTFDLAEIEVLDIAVSLDYFHLLKLRVLGFRS